MITSFFFPESLDVQISSRHKGMVIKTILGPIYLPPIDWSFMNVFLSVRYLHSIGLDPQ